MDFQAKTTFKSLLVCIGVLSLVACTLGPGKGGQGDYPSTGQNKVICTGTPDDIYKPIKCQDGINSFYDLSVMKEFDAPVPPAQILLRVNVAYGPHPQENRLVIGINGIKAVRPDGYTGFDDACTTTSAPTNNGPSNHGHDYRSWGWPWGDHGGHGDHDGDNGGDGGSSGTTACGTTRYIILNDLTLNGGTDIYTYLMQIRNKHGQLKISLQAPDIKILSTQLEITSQANCVGNPSPSPSPTPSPQPTPTPTPGPPAPNVSISATTPSTSTTNSTNMSVSFTADEHDVTFMCALDSASPSTCNSPATYSGLTNGSHTFTVTATNSAGVTSQPATYQWTVDTIPPVVTIQPVPSPTNANPVTVTFTSDTGIAYYCALDGVTSALCTSPLSLPNIAEGTHILSVQAVDSVGNMSDASTVQWVEDLTPPTVQILSQTPSASISNVNSRTITFVANESSTYQCSLDGSAYATCNSPYATNNLSAGQHSFSVEATDAAGNLGLAATASWTNDYTIPVIQLGQVIPAAGLTNSQTYSVAFSSSEDGSTFYCSMDASAATPCTSPFTGSFSGQGSHEFDVYAIDLAGNQSATVPVDWSVDWTDGVLSWSSVTPTGAEINTSAITLVVSATKPESLVATLNGNSVPVSDSTISLSGLAEGNYTVQVNGVDAAGNPTNTLSYQFTVDMTPPQLTVTSTVSGPTPNQATSNTFTMSANEAVTYQCQLDGAGFSNCQSPDQIDGLIDGSHEFDVIATDPAGNASTTSTTTWIVDTTPPVTTATATQVSYGDFTFTFSTNETVSTTYCSLDGAAPVTCTSPYAVKALAAGNHSMVIHSVDLAGNVENPGATLSFVATSPPPPANTVLVAPNYTITNQTSVTFQFSSSAQGATFTCSLDGAAMTACTSPVNYSGLTNATHTFKVIASNSIGQPDPTGGKSFTWTVDTVVPVLTITSTVSSGATTNQTANTFTITSSKPNVTLQCELDGAAMTACSSPISYSGLANGPHTFSAQGTDAAGNVSAAATVTWTIDTTPPVTTATVDTSNSSQGVLTFTFSANKAVQGFYCSLDGASPVSCSSPYTISNVTFGTHTMNIHAVDTYGNVESPGPTLTVTMNAPNANTILVAPSFQYTNQTTITFTFSSNVSNATFLCALNSTNYSACTSPMTYTGLADGSYTFNVIAVNQTGQRDSSGGQSFTWIVDTVPPKITTYTPTPSSTSVTIAWTTNEPATGMISYGVGYSTTTSTTETTTTSTSHSITVSGLMTGTQYTMQISGHDRAGNAYAGSTFTVKTRN